MLVQDGSESGSTRGYFLVPEEDEWPKCVRGEKVLQALKFVKGDSLKEFLLPGPLCSPPPEVPFEGSVES